MFDRLAPRYDLLNRLFSLGRDLGWRRRLARRLALLLGDRPGLRVLDLAAGTGDQTLALLGAGLDLRVVYALDRSRGMLGLALPKLAGSPALLIEGDALALPFPDGSLDAVTMSFGIRNLVDRRGEVLREIRRVLRPGGAVLILELAVPSHPLIRPFALFHMRHIVPLVGACLHGNRAPYRYLDRSIEEFPKPAEFLREMREAGFGETRVSGMTLGVARIWEGRKLQ
jgi:demethylmenaquinone methyltransferase/2-methoxy-6-polyprenyl-1,4-benzoquinol methylase